MASASSIPKEFHLFGGEHDLALSAERCRRSLSEFVKRFWDIVVPEHIKWNWHMDAICEHLMAVSNGQIRKLAINVPPGSAKSTLVSVMWPAWEWIDKPGEQSLFGSYDEALALRDSVRCRKVFDSQLYKRTFRPKWGMSKDQNAKGYYTNTVNGNRYTFGINSSGKTGWRGNKVCMDDGNDVKQRYNAEVKAQAWDVWKSVLKSRVNDLPTAKFLNIQQRVGHDDYTGHMTEDSEKLVEMGDDPWVLLVIPAEFEPSRRFFTPLGWTDPRTEEGELFFPLKYPKKELDILHHIDLGDEAYSSQYQQSPFPAGGSRFEKTDFLLWRRLSGDLIQITNKHGKTSIIKLDLLFTFVSVDLAASEKQTADYTVFAIWALTAERDLILLNIVRDRLSEPKIVEKAIAIHSFTGYNGRKHIAYAVEANGLGLPIAQAMDAAGLPVIYVNIHRTDKLVRSATAVIRAKAGKIYVPEDNAANPWLHDWLEEHIKFPGGEHDDQVDTTSLACTSLTDLGIGSLGEGIKIEIPKKQAHEVLEPKTSNKNIRERLLANGSK